MTKPSDVLTLSTFLAWARTKPQNEVFNYADNNDCSIAQFLKAQGYQDVVVYGYDYSVGDTLYNIPDSIHRGLAVLLKDKGCERTFGQLVHALQDDAKWDAYNEAMASAEPLTLSDM